MTAQIDTKKFLWLAIYFGVLIWSGIAPKDYPTWWLEVAPALIGLIVMAITYKSFPLTPMLYLLILIHCIILMVGGHYTYAEVPAFDWLKQEFDLSRNHYDKLGHLAQGFVPAMISREILLRLQVVKPGGWLAFIILCVCLAISAVYELIEWGVALVSEEAAESFLGTQGYVWDTQSDMFYALIGAVVALITLRRWHDRQLEKVHG